VWSEPAVIAVLANASAALEARTEDGETALHLAAKTGIGANVRALLQAGAEPDAADPKGRTPILAAISAFSEQPGRQQAVLALAEVSADLDRAFAATLADGFSAAALRLLERGADVNALDADGRSALANTVRQPGLTFFHLLLLRGADVNRFGPETLLAAAEFGRTDIARALLDRDVPVDSRDPRGATPLLLAVKGAHPATVTLLLAAGAARDPHDDFGLGLGDYMEVLPSLYEARIEFRQQSRAWRPTREIEVDLSGIRERQALIREMLGL
jgi:ankyrin repeat protein